MPTPCPKCRKLVNSDARTCPHCGDSLLSLPPAVPQPPPPPPPAPPQAPPQCARPGDSAPPPPPHISSRLGRANTDRTRGQRVARVAIIFGIIGVAAGLMLGVVSSQFFPFFGGFLTGIAEPFSPARLQSLPVHCVFFAGLGAVAFGGIAALLRYAV